MILLWIFIVISEVVRHWCLIKLRKVSPNKALSLGLRILIFAGFLYFDPTPFWISIFAYTMSGWYIHDYGLNLLLGNKFYYLNNTGPIDRFQRKYFGQDVWFWWKSIWFVSSVYLYFTWMI